LVPALAVLAWLLIGAIAGPYAGKLSDVVEEDNAAFLPAGAESTQVSEIEQDFAPPTTPLIVVWESPEPLPPDAAQQAEEQLQAVSAIEGIVGRPSPPIPSDDSRAITAVLQVGEDYNEEIADIIDQARAEVSGLDGGAAYVTGPAGFAADLESAFGGIDGLLLVVALGVVLLILLVVYRSPILPVVVLLSAVFAFAAAAYVVYQLAEAGTLDLNGQSQGIMSILVVGAATDYALLLAARFREELREERSRFDAMRVALRQVAGPILASGGTVILGVLCLLFSDLTSNRSLGPVAALGIAGALLSALIFLPAALVLLGRAAYWPFRPAYGSQHPEERGVWSKVAGTVRAHPRRWWLGVTVALAACAALLPLFKADGVSETELFLNPEESVAGQEALVRHFPAGAGTPAVIVVPEAARQQAQQVAADTSGVEQVLPVAESGQAPQPNAAPKVVDGQVLLEATLADPSDSAAAQSTVSQLRENLDEVGEEVLVGGTAAQALDSNQVSQRDRTVIIPIVLVVILLVLMLLLRSVLAPVLLILTVVLSFAATLGIAGLVFDVVFGWPGADPGVPLFAFVFLVALGIDYNIFLMTRVREESVRLGTREGILKGLVVTGGVITSAGVVLAATFSALAVIPILFLAQIAFLVAFGVLLDTFIVRSLLVPALAYDVGPRIWWPSRLQHDPPTEPAEHQDPDPTAAAAR
jgi:RND superfamily putative drug exporter